VLGQTVPVSSSDNRKENVPFKISVQFRAGQDYRIGTPPVLTSALFIQ